MTNKTMSHCPFCHAITLVNESTQRRYSCGTFITKTEGVYSRRCGKQKQMTLWDGEHESI